MVRREAIWLRWLARKTVQKMVLPSLHAMRSQVDDALQVLDSLETQRAASSRVPGGRILRYQLSSGKPQADDLTVIRGIGAATAGRLRLAGVNSYADLASRTPDELARLTRRSAKRVTTERWIEQAREIASTGRGIPARQSSRRVQ